jgi:para-nitrobenzyl esterase
MSIRVLVRSVFALVVASAVFAGAAASGSAADGTPATVAVTGGTLHGVAADGVASFRGIPYAAPPVGALRWQPPAAPAAWTGARDASAFGNSCPQGKANGVFANPSATEDCLYLNVFAPANASGKRAVIVWFPGGGLVGGSSTDYDASGLVKTGNVIVVSVNYRVGALGFFAYPALDAERHEAGDYGLMDQQYALQWVQRNIGAFGGDPANVTIAGESAGALTVLAHMVAPESAHLFARAIMESSGTPPVTARGVPTIDVAEATGTRFATAAGCADMACLRALPADKVVDVQSAFRFGLIGGPNTPIPVIFHAAFTAGTYNHVPVLTGTNHNEWRWSVANAELNSGKPLTADRYSAAIAAFYGTAMAPAIINEYQVAAFPSPSEAVGTAETDGYMACGTLKLADWLSPSVPVYDYQFDDANVPMYMPPVSFPYGPAHTTELQFLFPLFHGGSGAIRPLSSAEQTLAHKMMAYWTNFAKTGNPNGPSLPAWPKFTAANEPVLSLDVPNQTVITNFADQHRCKFWDGQNNY